MSYRNNDYLGKIRERIIEPYWNDILMSIEAIEAEVRTRGEVRDYGVYEDSDASDNETTNVGMSLNTGREVLVDTSDLPGMIQHDS